MKDKKRIVNTISFYGMECLTDTVIYILYKYYKNDAIFSYLNSVNLDTCRYVTDFGVELLTRTTGRDNLVRESTSRGCEKIVNHFYTPFSFELIELDIFKSNKFSKFNQNDHVEYNSYKVYILNDTKLCLSKFIKSKEVQLNRNLIEFAQFNITEQSNEIKFNILEIDSVFLFILFCRFLIIIVIFIFKLII